MIPVFLPLPGLVQAQPQVPRPTEPRTALVIGNALYRDAPLKNPVNDARAMAQALGRCGFQVTLLENASRERMFSALRTFGQHLGSGGVGLFYYAGHGMQVKGRNYLIPVGADISAEDEVAVQALDAEAVLAKMETARNRLNILILDACRSNPFAHSSRSGSAGLAPMEAPVGSFVAFATAPGRTAADGTDANGSYTGALLRVLTTPGLKLEEVFKATRAEVLARTGGAQVPWENSSVVGDFYFVGGGAPSEPRGIAIEPVRRKVESAPATWTNNLGMAFVRIPAGSFLMGSVDGGWGDERPAHRVTFQEPFYMGQTEVTQAQWRAVMGTLPCKAVGDEVPVEKVTWEEAQAFVKALNAKEGGTRYRLPTEAEWEYACRAGTTTAYFFGDDKKDLPRYAWVGSLGAFYGSAFGAGSARPVAQKQPNPWGLYDMIGNVWEWCEDVWHKGYEGAPSDGQAWLEGGKPGQRVLRGGGWNNPDAFHRSAYRAGFKVTERSAGFGFRLVALPSR